MPAADALATALGAAFSEKRPAEDALVLVSLLLATVLLIVCIDCVKTSLLSQLREKREAELRAVKNNMLFSGLFGFVFTSGDAMAARLRCAYPMDAGTSDLQCAGTNSTGCVSGCLGTTHRLVDAENEKDTRPKKQSFISFVVRLWL